MPGSEPAAVEMEALAVLMALSWKAGERRIAALLGGERVPVSGRARGYAPDVQHHRLAIEIKSRKRPLAMIVEMLDQAEKARDWAKRRDGKDRLAVGIYHVDGTHFGKSYVVLRLDDFLALGLHE